MEPYYYNQLIYDNWLHKQLQDLIKTTIPSQNMQQFMEQTGKRGEKQVQEIGSGDNGTIVISQLERGTIGNRYSVKVVQPSGQNINPSAVLDENNCLVITLGTDQTGQLDPQKNTAKNIQNQINTIFYFIQIHSGTGQGIISPETEKQFQGGTQQERLFGKNLFLYEEPIILDYIVTTMNQIRQFVYTIYSEQFGKDFIPEKQIVFLSPHETFNFEQRYGNRDFRLPLVIVRIDKLPMTQDLHSIIPYVSFSEGYMFDTRKHTKDFIKRQLARIEELPEEEQEDAKEELKQKIFPTLFYDQVMQQTTLTIDVIQETERDLNRLFVLMNTKYFRPIKRKFHFVISLEQLIKQFNIQLREIQRRFQFPIFYLVDYTVQWQEYTSQTTFEKDQWNLPRQTYTFEFIAYPITRFNLAGTLLRLDLDAGITVSENWEDVETIFTKTYEM